jgi:peptidoglycan/LPS O-acetylase OafA/YrhL
MNLDLRTILLAVAVILFVIAVFSTTHWDDLVAWGLAAFAASFLVGGVDLGGFGSGRRR